MNIHFLLIKILLWNSIYTQNNSPSTPQEILTDKHLLPSTELIQNPINIKIDGFSKPLQFIHKQKKQINNYQKKFIIGLFIWLLLNIILIVIYPLIFSVIHSKIKNTTNFNNIILEMTTNICQPENIDIILNQWNNHTMINTPISQMINLINTKVLGLFITIILIIIFTVGIVLQWTGIGSLINFFFNIFSNYSKISNILILITYLIINWIIMVIIMKYFNLTYAYKNQLNKLYLKQIPFIINENYNLSMDYDKSQSNLFKIFFFEEYIKKFFFDNQEIRLYLFLFTSMIYFYYISLQYENINDDNSMKMWDILKEILNNKYDYIYIIGAFILVIIVMITINIRNKIEFYEIYKYNNSSQD